MKCPPLRFDWNQSQLAHDAWRFNCGPGALCAVLGMTPDEIRPHLLDFERKGYTNPTLMATILKALGIRYRSLYQSHHAPVQQQAVRWPSFGLVRIQWGGRWTRPGVPMAARYRHTHWIAVRPSEHTRGPRDVFDINAIGVGGWLPWWEWHNELAPWLIKEAAPGNDGTFWPTHCWEIEGKESTDAAR